MAKISLRAYNHEIENLIEHGQTEEGIAHCKYILKSYSKHLDTYRLLVKAYLESQRYSEAADILQRILSVEPDDFVSQIGMSIIREDEGNLDAAIYHMERAFEIQSANVAIQDELRRLYGRRDGTEPSKLRMTRGALVRMYARGDLYRQAIAEARVAIKEDPQRLDLEIILARMYFQTGHKTEAVEISSRIISKLPFCFEANRILAEVLPETSRAEDAKTYRQKLTALDPYLEYSSGTIIDSRQVSDNAVEMDRLAWTPSLESSPQPAWADSLGVKLNETENEQLPDWMPTVPSTDPGDQVKSEEQNEIPPRTEEEAPFESQVEPIAPNPQGQTPNNELPDWMKTSGWEISSEPAQEIPETNSEIERIPAEPTAIPDWIKEISQVPDSSLTSKEAESNQDLDWANSILPTEVVHDDLTDQALVEPSGTEEIPAIPEIKPSAPQNEELPDWFKSTTLPVDEAMFASQSNEPLPDWLTETPHLHEDITKVTELPGSKDLVIPSAGHDDIQIPAPLRDQPEQVEIDPNKPAIQTDFVPVINLHESNSESTSSSDNLAWLESSTAKNSLEEDTLLTQAEESLEPPSEWVSKPTIDTTFTDTSDLKNEQANEELLVKKSSEVEFNGPSDDISPQSVEIPMAVEQNGKKPFASQLAENDHPAVTLPDEESIVPVEQTQTMDSVINKTDESPILVENNTDGSPLLIENNTELSPLPGENITEDAISQSVSPKMEGSEPVDMDAAFAWLESLAAKQGAEADSLLVAAEERQDTPPDWVQTQAAEIGFENEPSPGNDSDQSIEPLPDWLQSSADANPPSDASQPGDQVLPEWLMGLESSSGQRDALSSEQPQASNELPPVGSEWTTKDSGQTGETLSAQADDQTQNKTEGFEIPKEFEKPSELGKTRPLPSWMVSDLENANLTESLLSQQESIEEMPQPDGSKEEELPALEHIPPTSLPFTSETPDLPDWLKNLEAEQEEEPLPLDTVPAQKSEPQANPVLISSVPSEMLEQAQSTLSDGQINLSMSIYSQLIQRDQHVEETIHDLRDALYRYPVESEIWQTLGDAYFRGNHVQDALDAYTKAEELLK